jgi:hypothetical protein
MTFNQSPSIAKKIDIANFVYSIAEKITEIATPIANRYMGAKMLTSAEKTSAKATKLCAEIDNAVKSFATGFYAKPYGVNLMVYMSNSRNVMLKLTIFEDGTTVGYSEFYLASAEYFSFILNKVYENKAKAVDLATVQQALADVERLEGELRNAMSAIPYYIKK